MYRACNAEYIGRSIFYTIMTKSSTLFSGLQKCFFFLFCQKTPLRGFEILEMKNKNKQKNKQTNAGLITNMLNLGVWCILDTDSLTEGKTINMTAALDLKHCVL